MEITEEHRKRWKSGDPFDIPEDPDMLELMVGWFWDRIRIIVSIENHILKFDGPQQVLDILGDAAKIERINMSFAYSGGQWWILDPGTEEDVMNLPRLAKRFSRIYRHHASEYETGEGAALKLKGFKGNLKR